MATVTFLATVQLEHDATQIWQAGSLPHFPIQDLACCQRVKLIFGAQ